MIIIEKAQLKDSVILTRIKTAAYRDEKRRFGPWQVDGEGPDWYIKEWYNDVTETESLIRNFHYYKLIHNTDIVGCFWLRIADERTIELNDFCIHPEHQGKGYGYKTLLMMASLFPEKNKWTLGTPFYSVRNQHLYTKAGYIKVGEKANHMVFLYEKKV
ncbi:GNAT family N-acetyltransferase [Vallitalea pronyensis]|uniref:GNAT family N-acetyltransferase n=1 Tax=Vallitalea pronyensis TaxID=1348613 RepID=A0A8J8MN49_9FIRM|nr:GNAT family N-acetyltransferase [Vallitalea pronyensis]QUI24293.1 GNAT family N-acetyltransferase [Vallitalea pronyensis]